MVISVDIDGESPNLAHGKKSFQVIVEEILERNNGIW